jgi:hypothetical protein
MRSHSLSLNALDQRVVVVSASIAFAAVLVAFSSLDEAAAERVRAPVPLVQTERQGFVQSSLAPHTSSEQAVPSLQFPSVAQQAVVSLMQAPVLGLQLSTVQARLSLHAVVIVFEHEPPEQVSVVQALLSLHSALVEQPSSSL